MKFEFAWILCILTSLPVILVGNTVLGFPTVSSDKFLMLWIFVFTLVVKSMNKSALSACIGAVDIGFFALQILMNSGSAPAIGNIAIDSGWFKIAGYSALSNSAPGLAKSRSLRLSLIHNLRCRRTYE